MLCFLFSLVFNYGYNTDKLDSSNANKFEANRPLFFVNNSKDLIQSDSDNFNTNILTGAERMHLYLPLLKNKRVGIFSNQTSIVRTGNNEKYIHLIDTLLKLGIQIQKIFVPEHGLLGNGDAGEFIKNSTDSVFHIDIISLYGVNKSPTKEALKDIDILVFDIQDVGVRFYTYISSLQYLLEAALKHNIEFLLLDRPNPNGFYIDGPILNSKYKSFVGLQKIPVVYGMTMAEYAQMIYFEDLLNIPKKDTIDNEEFINAYLEERKKFSFTIVPCKTYSHLSRYHLPLKPSPNLKTMQSVYLYPSLCLFEGTKVSLGRGTQMPFSCYGFPEYEDTSFTFTPVPKSGAKTPPYVNQKCYGQNLSQINIATLLNIDSSQGSLFSLTWLIDAYKKYPNKKDFFDLKKFNLLSGTPQLHRQIIAQENEVIIKASWKQELQKFQNIRHKYLLYKDF